MNLLTISVLLAINIVFNIEAALVEFLLPLVALEFGILPKHSQLLLILYYAAIMITLAVLLSANSPALDTRMVLLGGAGAFALGCLCIVSSVYGLIIAGRVLQGAGVAAMVMSTPAIIAQRRDSFDLPFSPYALIPMSIGIGMLVGPTLGAAVIAIFGVQALLASLAALSLAAAALVLVIPKDRTRTVHQEPAASMVLRRFDYPGVIATALILTAFYALFVSASGESDALLALCIAAATTILAAWLFHQSDRESDNPVLDVQFLFRDSTVGRMNVVAITSFASTYAVAYVLPFYVYYVVLAQRDELLLGGTMVLVSLGFMASVGIAKLPWSCSQRGMLSLCGALMATACLAFLVAAMVDSTHFLLGAAFLMGLSRGGFVHPYNSLTLHTTPVYRIDAASAYNAAGRYLGMMLGVVCGAAAIWRADGYVQALEIACGASLALTLLSMLALFVAVGASDSTVERRA